jgi:hypothetical protein
MILMIAVSRKDCLVKTIQTFEIMDLKRGFLAIHSRQLCNLPSVEFHTKEEGENTRRLYVTRANWLKLFWQPLPDLLDSVGPYWYEIIVDLLA